MKSRLIMCCCLAWLLAANDCIARIDTVPTESAENNAAADSAATPMVPNGGDTMTQEVLFLALSLVGVKYQYGGGSVERGFDCSGFVRFVFNQSLAMNLPRSSYAMSRLGSEVGKDALEPGDLLFYDTLRRRFSHVAIYLGEGRFVHAPSRGKQIEIVDMSDRYWQKRFNGARRIVKVD